MPDIKASCALVGRFNNTQVRYALEVEVSSATWGIVDCVTAEFHYENLNGIPIVTTYEIKTSLSDFKSKNGHNHVGDYSYYVVTKKLYPKIKDLIPYTIGIMTYDEEKGLLRVVRKPYINRSLSIDQKFHILNKMLLKWCTGSMNAELHNMGYKQKNGLTECPTCHNMIKNYNLMSDGLCYVCWIKKIKEEK